MEYEMVIEIPEMKERILFHISCSSVWSIRPSVKLFVSLLPFNLAKRRLDALDRRSVRRRTGNYTGKYKHSIKADKRPYL
jgi:hypothetical protein